MGFGFEDSGDAGTLDADAYLQGFAACMGFPLSEADWVAALGAAIQPIAPALALLPRIRANVRSAVLTNNNLLVQRHFSSLYPKVASSVGNLAFVSAEFGARKPDPEVYRLCVSRLGVEPGAALFVDDSADNVKGAQAAGLDAYHTVDTADLAAELDRYGLLV